MLDGSQCTSMICWLYLKTCRNYISFSWMDILLSKKLIVSFRFMGLDQIHEQNNSVMKGMGGATPTLNKVGVFPSMNWYLLPVNTNLKRTI